MENNRLDKKYVKTILFSAWANSRYVKANPIAKFGILILLSTGVVLSIDRPVPELYYNLAVLFFAIIFLAESKTLKYLVKSYLVLLIFAFFIMFLWWLIFNQIGTNPIFSYSFLGVTFSITWLSFYVALGKMTGFAAMSFLTLLTVMTTRDADIISALRKIGVPFKAVFFVSIVSRSLNILTEDLETIRQAQFSRGSRTGRFGVFSKIKDFIKLSIPLTASIIRRAVEVGGAMEARGFSKTKKFTGFIDEKGFRWYDGVMLAFGAAMVAVPLLKI